MSARVLTEKDIISLVVEGGWSDERCRITNEEINRPLGLVKHPFDDNKIGLFNQRVNAICARFIWEIRQRAATTSAPPVGSLPKMSTTVHRDLTKLDLAIDTAIQKMDEFWMLVSKVVDDYFRCFGGQSNTPVRLEETFRETWGNGFRALMSFIAACERHEQSGVSLSSDCLASLEAVATSLDEVASIINHLRPATWDVMDYSFETLSARSAWPVQADCKESNTRENILAWLSLLKSVARLCPIKVKRGRDEVALKTMIESLADVYCWLTDHEPRRIYQPDLKNSDIPAHEAGDFLALVKDIAAIAGQRLHAEDIRVSPSLSSLVRAILEQRKARKDA